MAASAGPPAGRAGGAEPESGAERRVSLLVDAWPGAAPSLPAGRYSSATARMVAVPRGGNVRRPLAEAQSGGTEPVTALRDPGRLTQCATAENARQNGRRDRSVPFSAQPVGAGGGAGA